VTLSRQQLVEALRAVEYPTRKPSSGQMALVRLCVGDNCLSAETVNESSRFLFGAATGRHITAHYAALMDAASNAPGDELTLTVDGARLRVSCGKFKAFVAMEPADCWVERAATPVSGVLTVPSKSLAESLKFAIQCAYKENGRPELESVILSTSCGTLTVGASNGRVVAMSESECIGEGGLKIHFKAAAEIVAATEKSSVTLLGSSENSTVVHCGNLRMEFAKPAMVVHVIDQWRANIRPGLGAEICTATVPKQRLCQAMEYGCSITGDAIPAVNLSVSGGLLRVDAAGRSGAMNDEIACDDSRGETEISLSGKMIPPMLRAMRGDYVRMGMHDRTPGVLFSNGSQTLFACAMRAS